MGELEARSGLQAIGEYVLRDKNGNIKQIGDVIEGNIERDDKGNVIAFTDPNNIRHLDFEVENDGPN
jgi:hypothetical protein